jgi:hypothetical protein
MTIKALKTSQVALGILSLMALALGCVFLFRSFPEMQDADESLWLLAIVFGMYGFGIFIGGLQDDPQKTRRHLIDHYYLCTNCGKEMRGHTEGAYWLYPDEGITHRGKTYSQGLIYCNRCPRPDRPGKLYRIDKEKEAPANQAACDFEKLRAGWDGSLYDCPEDVPNPEA